MDVQIAFNSEEEFFDIGLSGGDLTSDSGLETAVIMSLFCDRRANADDELPGNTDDLRGWWGDSFADIDGDMTGSRLWLLSRSKNIKETANRAVEYAKEALQWMVEDGVAKSIEVEHDQFGSELDMAIRITRPDGTTLTFRYSDLWEKLNAV